MKVERSAAVYATINNMTTATRTVSVNPDVLSYVLDRASEEDAKRLLAHADASSGEPVVRSGWVPNSLTRAAVELFTLGEFSILRSFVAAYAHALGSRPVSEGGSYALEVVDAFVGHEDGALDSHYVDGVSDAIRHGMRNHLRASTYIECWALVSPSDMLGVMQEPWKDVEPFRTTSWVGAQKSAIQEINDADWSSYNSLRLHVGNHKSPPHESLIGHFAIGYTVDRDGKAHRGDGNTRAHALIGQGADTVLVHHTRPFGTVLNGIALSPEVVTF